MEVAEVWAKGGEGAEKLAILAAKVAEQCVCKLKPLYEWSWDIEKKIETIAKEIYGAAAIVIQHKPKAVEKNSLWDCKLPVCIAKTQNHCPIILNY